MSYQGYTPDTTDAEARRRFRDKYGREPEVIIRTAGAVLAGPVEGVGIARRPVR